jgi:nitroreductase
MKEQELLDLIRSRRSVMRFASGDVSDGQVQSILEAGRWAPSYINSQPWGFIVVRDKDIRGRISTVMKRVTIAWEAFESAPLVLFIVVDPREDPKHFAEDGAAAAQNMSLMAHALGLASFWAGVLDAKGGHGSPEAELREVLKVPPGMRIVAALPVGTAAYKPESSRKPLEGMTHRDQFEGNGISAG